MPQTNLPSVCPICAGGAIEKGFARAGALCDRHPGNRARRRTLAPRPILNQHRMLLKVAWGKL